MALLKKIKGATLIETLIASALIVLVFLVASLSFNNIFGGVSKRNDHKYLNRVKELTYFANHKQLTLPFEEDTPQWTITITELSNVQLMKCFYKANPAKDIEKLIETNERN
ncbi:MAG: hypothetical protein AAF489_13075 [Bacteroidota bacterium]